MNRICRRLLVATIILAWTLPAFAAATSVVETFDDGSVKVKYFTDDQGRKQGNYVENYEKGRPKIHAQYRNDKLNGSYTEYSESGIPRLSATYANGILHGPYTETDEKGLVLKDQVFWNGNILYPNSAHIVNATLQAILAGRTSPVINPEDAQPPAAPAGGSSGVARPASRRLSPATAFNDDAVAALRFLNACRFLASVPFDVTIKLEYADLAAAAAEICQKMGHGEHHPANPGMPEDEYKYAVEGTSHSNLSSRITRLAGVRDFMNDYPVNDLIHRRWCLNPAMARTGFGTAGIFTIMYAMDTSRKDVPDYDFVTWPARGYMPATYFGSKFLWSVSPNPQKYQGVTQGEVQVTVYPLLPGGPIADPHRRGPPIPLDVLTAISVAPGVIAGGGPCIAFHPTAAPVQPGARYWVEITGLKTPGGEDTKIEYLVEFI